MVDVLGEDAPVRRRWVMPAVIVVITVLLGPLAVNRRDRDSVDDSLVLLSSRSVSYGGIGTPSLRRMVFGADVHNDGPRTVRVGNPRLVGPGISSEAGPPPEPVAAGDSMQMEVVAVLACPQAVTGVAQARFEVTAVPLDGDAREVTVRSGPDLPIAGVVQSVCRQADRFG